MSLSAAIRYLDHFSREVENLFLVVEMLWGGLNQGHHLLVRVLQGPCVFRHLLWEGQINNKSKTWKKCEKKKTNKPPKPPTQPWMLPCCQAACHLPVNKNNFSKLDNIDEESNQYGQKRGGGWKGWNRKYRSPRPLQSEGIRGSMMNIIRWKQKKHNWFITCMLIDSCMALAWSAALFSPRTRL